MDSLYNDCYNKGWVLAEQELRNNKASIFIGGLRSGRPRLDYVTGLPLKPIHGCIVTNELEFIKKGHNDRIYKYISESGIPSFSHLWKYQFKHNIFSYLQNFYEKAPEKLWNDCPIIYSYDSIYRFEITNNSGNNTLFVRTRDTSTVFQIPGGYNDTLSLFWGPENINIAFILTPKNRDIVYMIDLDNYELHMVTQSTSYILK